MKPIIDPLPPAELAAEMARTEPLGTFRGLAIHVLSGDEFPYIMREIGRLRETSFREVGAGRDVDCDIDALDFGPAAYRQLVVWDPREAEIVAVYRYQRGWLALDHGDQVLRTHNLFRYSPTFDAIIKPACIELGRSVVNRSAKRQTLGLFAIWTGLHALLDAHPQLQYYFGNVSLYGAMDPFARDLLIAYLEHHYRPPEPVLLAHPELRHVPDTAAADQIPVEASSDPRERIRVLRELLAPYDEEIPPILQSYMGLSHEIWFGETARDADFGDALEIGLVVPVEAIQRSQALARFAPTPATTARQQDPEASVRRA